MCAIVSFSFVAVELHESLTETASHQAICRLFHRVSKCRLDLSGGSLRDSRAEQRRSGAEGTSERSDNGA